MNAYKQSWRTARPFYLTTDEGRSHWLRRIESRIELHNDRKNGRTQIGMALATLYGKVVHAVALVNRRVRYHRRQTNHLLRRGVVHPTSDWAEIKRITKGG